MLYIAHGAQSSQTPETLAQQLDIAAARSREMTSSMRRLLLALEELNSLLDGDYQPDLDVVFFDTDHAVGEGTR